MPASMTWRGRLPDVRDIPNPVYDGDTLWLCTDQGDWYRKVRDIRLENVFAPELKQVGGPECRRFVIDWLARYGFGRWPYSVDTLQTSTGNDIRTFNRYVCQVWNSDRTESLNLAVTEYIRQNGYPGGTGS
jgi:endonuclease YncB( thermonuclease family)